MVPVSHRMALAAFLAAFPAAASAQPAPTFADVAPILNARCITCHSGDFPPNGLDLTSLETLRSGGWAGAVATPGDPAGSEIVHRIRGIATPRMPLNGPPYLDDGEIALIEAWIEGGMAEGEAVAAARRRERPAPGDPVAFADVEPIFLQRCVKCHTEGGLRGAPPEGLRLNTREDIFAGGERAVVVPGHAGASQLARRILGQSLPRMPLDGPPFLDEDETRLILDWISQGAPDDDGVRAPVPEGREVRLEGTLTGEWSLDGTPLSVGPGTRIDDAPGIGERVEVRGRVAPDGSIAVTRLRRR